MPCHKKPIVVNFFGGPGCRKSTMAASVFSKLKWKGVNCEYTGEFAKDLVWEKSFNVLENQIYVFGHQHHKLWRLAGSVDVIVTDSPLLLSVIYDKEERVELKQLVLHEMERYTNLNFFIRRVAKFNQSGRVQDEGQSRLKDQEIMELLNGCGVEYWVIIGDEDNVDSAVDIVMEEINS